MKATAYHEAGHVVTALLLGARIRHVWIDGRRGSARVSYRRQSNSRMALQMVAVCLSGPVAEMIFTGQLHHPSELRQWRDDWQYAWKKAAHFYRNKRQRRQYLEYVAEVLFDHLKVAWKAIETLAEELLSFRVLDRDKVEEIFQHRMKRQLKHLGR